MNTNNDQDHHGQANSASQSFQAGDHVIIRLLTDRYFEAEGRGELIPAETRFIGSWERLQPTETHRYSILINEAVWTFIREEIELQPLSPEVPTWQEQERIANEDLACAKTYETQGKNELAWRYYGRAVVELQASGKAEEEVAKERFSYALLLVKADRETDALLQLEQSAHMYETKALDARVQMFRAHLDYAEAAVQMLIAMGSIYQHRMDLQEASSQRALRCVIDRLLTMNKLIKKRYETKVILLFEAAAFLHALGDDEAAVYFAQAEKYYTQQLAYLEGLLLVEPVQEVRERISTQLGTVKRPHPMKINLTAETPSELEEFLASLQEKLPGVRITRKVKQERTSPGTRAGFRATAIITWFPPPSSANAHQSD